MNKMIWIVFIVAMSLWCISPSMADVGVTDACQDNVKEPMDESLWYCNERLVADCAVALCRYFAGLPQATRKT